MIAVTNSTRAAVGVTHQGVWSVTVTPPGGSPTSLPVLGGECQKSSGGNPRTTVSIETPGELFPVVPPDRLLPFGTRASLQWSVGPDTYTIATGPVVASDLTRPSGLWTLNVNDDAALVQHDLVAPGEFTWNAGETVESLVTRLVQRTLPGWPVSASGDATTDTVEAELEPKPEDGAWDPWQLAQTAAGASGAECFFDSAGTLVIRDRPDLDTPVDSVGVDRDIVGHELQFERAVSRTIIVWLDRSASPPTITRTGIWDDTRPGSPTNQADIGRVAIARVQDGNPGQVKADRAARRWARRMAGYARNLSMQVVPRPWLEPGDTVTVALSAGDPEDHLIEEVTIPLSAEPMSIRCVNTRSGIATPV